MPARTVQQIYTNLISEKNTYSNLADLVPTTDDLPSLLADVGSSPSTVAVWRLWVYLFAYATWTLETLWWIFQGIIAAMFAALIPGTVGWYKTQVFAFQFGDALVYISSKWQYSPVNTAHCIVNLCAVTEAGGGIIIKAAILSGTTVSPLSSTQLAALTSYLQKVKYAGPPITVLSYAADIAWIPYTIYYDPLVLDNTGQSIANPGDYPVVDAINAYLASISGVNSQNDFDGTFDLFQLELAISEASGVADQVPGNIQCTNGSLPYATVNRNYQTTAGYIIVDPLHPLSATLTYVANV